MGRSTFNSPGRLGTVSNSLKLSWRFRSGPLRIVKADEFREDLFRNGHHGLVVRDLEGTTNIHFQALDQDVAVVGDDEARA